MWEQLPLLSLLIWLPILGAIAVLACCTETQAQRARKISLVFALLNLLLCIPLYLYFDVATPVLQFIEKATWISTLNIQYALGVDGIALPLVILTAFTTVIIILATWNSIQTKVVQYQATFLVMNGMMTGMFCAMDAILFYVFWEALLIPMFLCIGVWGSSNRAYASVKFFLYTFLGSVLMLAVILYLAYHTGSFAIADYYSYPMTLQTQVIIFIAFFMAFAVKVPMWPVHTWLPDAHTEAPAGGSVILAALMLKMGGYGFLRFVLPIVPDGAMALSTIMIVLSLIAIVYIGLVALIQTDMKRLIAYSSIAHMGFVTLACFMIFAIIENNQGEFAAAAMAIEGAMIQMISHAFSSGALFLGVGILYDRLHSRQITDFGGVAQKMPVFAALYLVFILANVGLPGTSAFVGEFLVILSAFQASFWIAFFAASSLVLAAAYSLWMYKRVFFAEVTNEKVEHLTDIQGIEKFSLILLVIPVIFFGVYPEPILNLLHASVNNLLELSTMSKLI